MPRMPDLWRNRDYLVLWSGQVVSVTGSQVSDLAVPLLVLSLTHSAASAGLITALFGVPYPVLGMAAGVFADRHDRKRVMILAQVGNALAMGSVAAAIAVDRLTMVQLGVVALAAGSAGVVFDVAEVAALPSVVAREHLPAAVAQNQTTFSVSGLAGPALGGLLFSAGRAFPFLADALSYLASLLTLRAIRVPFQGERESGRRGIASEIRDGLTWLWRQPAVRTLTLLTAGYNILTGGFDLLIIVLAQRQHASPVVIGLIFGIASAGALFGASIAPWVQKRLSIGAIVIAFLVIAAALYPLYLIAPDAAVIGLINAAVFVVSPIYNVAVLTYRLALTPEALQGRVNSAARTFTRGAVPIGGTLMGLSLQWIHVSGTIWILTGGTALLALAALSSNSVRGARRAVVR